jgi:tetratricopeptide (TPR) repeat protein
MKGKMLGHQFVENLNRALLHRNVAEGVAMLNRAAPALAEMNPQTPYAAELLFLVAQWVDVGYKDYRLLDSLLGNFPVQSRRKMPLDDYLRLRMVEAFRAVSVWEADKAIEALDFVLRAEKESPDEYLVTVALFWKARAHRKKGEYEAALEDIVRARKLAQSSRDHLMLTAVIQIQESWLLFQKGLRKEAWRLLAHAETVLGYTDHYLALGNIESARGRIERRAGEYAKALDHFGRAIDLYSKGDPNHRNVARTLVNAAYVKRLLALQLRKRIDAQASKPGQARGGRQVRTAAPGGSSFRERYQQLCDEAMLDLRRAREIYVSCGHLGGMGSVLLNTGYLHLDRGEIDRAAQEALEAYRIGLEKNDHILMARARILQATTENAHVEEQLGEDVDTAIHADHAKQYSEEALELAHQTQNRRLLAGAFIVRGMTAANDFFQEWEMAKRCAAEATELIGAGENDHLLDDLAALKSRIVKVHGINDSLRAWSEGVVGDKTFQQITEEFAEVVIPKVWVREEKKISRVAHSLSISPKKVRRILRNAGLLGRG